MMDTLWLFFLIEENSFENVVCKMSAILFRYQWNTLFSLGRHFDGLVQQKLHLCVKMNDLSIFCHYKYLDGLVQERHKFVVL